MQRRHLMIAGSLASVTWVLISEIFPNRVSGLGMAASVSTFWAASFVLTYTVPPITNAIGMSGAFLVYCAVCFIGVALVLSRFPRRMSIKKADIGPKGASGDVVDVMRGRSMTLIIKRRLGRPTSSRWLLRFRLHNFFRDMETDRDCGCRMASHSKLSLLERRRPNFK